MCFELQLMVPGINIIIDFYLAYFRNKNILGGLLGNNRKELVIAMSHLI